LVKVRLVIVEFCTVQEPPLKMESWVWVSISVD
jgi:hypothetical protein